MTEILLHDPALFTGISMHSYNVMDAESTRKKNLQRLLPFRIWLVANSTGVPAVMHG